jgi:hypothetical protein
MQVKRRELPAAVEWRLGSLLHREDGPAIEWGDGDRSWYYYGKIHRLDGPSIETVTHFRHWHLYGERLAIEDLLLPLATHNPSVPAKKKYKEILLLTNFIKAKINA